MENRNPINCMPGTNSVSPFWAPFAWEKAYGKQMNKVLYWFLVVLSVAVACLNKTIRGHLEDIWESDFT